MQGFIRERRPGRYTVYWETQDMATGARRQHTRSGFTRKEPARPPKGDSAREFLNVVVGKVTSGDWKKDQPLTVKELLEDHWLPAQRSRNLRPTTLSQYDDVIRAWIVPHVGAVRASALTPKNVQALVDKLRTTETSQGRKGLSARSLQLVVGTLKSAYKFAVETELLSRDPLVGVRRPTVEQRQPTTWTDLEAREFLATTKDDRLTALWALALTRGLRRGELCGLRWSAIDLPGGTLQVVHTLVMVDGKPQTSSPKTRAGVRSVPLDASLVSFLTAQRKVQAAERLKAGEAWQDGGYVFTDELGKPYSPDFVSKRFEDLVEVSGLPRIRLHDLRHTACSLMLAAGVQPKVVQELAGHSNISITLGIYGHTTPSMGRQAGEALSASLLG